MVYDIVSIGSAMRDVFLIEQDFKIKKERKTHHLLCLEYGSKIEVDEIFFDIGGGGVNTATTFVHMGLRTGLVAQVGDDDNGRLILETLKTRGISTEFVRVRKNGFTGYSTILSGYTGDRTVLVARGVSAQFSHTNNFFNHIKTKWVCLTPMGGNFTALDSVLRECVKKHIRVAYIPGKQELEYGIEKLHPLLQTPHVLILNREEAALLTKNPSLDIRESFRRLLKSFSGCLCITDGFSGAYLYSKDYGGKIFFSPAQGIKAKNSLGAGDAFASGFISGLLRRHDPHYAFRLALLNSGSVVRLVGASRGLLKKIPTDRTLSNVKIHVFSSI